MQFVITTDAGYEELGPARRRAHRARHGQRHFIFLRKSVELDRPKTTIHIDRNRAGDLGDGHARDRSQPLDHARDGYVNRFSLAERSYEVIPQVAREHRLDPPCSTTTTQDAAGALVPLSNLVRFENGVEPSKRTQFQQLNSLTIEGILAPGVPLGDAIVFLEAQAREILPGATAGTSWANPASTPSRAAPC